MRYFDCNVYLLQLSLVLRKEAGRVVSEAVGPCRYARIRVEAYETEATLGTGSPVWEISEEVLLQAEKR